MQIYDVLQIDKEGLRYKLGTCNTGCIRARCKDAIAMDSRILL